MLYLSKYAYMVDINKTHYLFNLNKGALIELDDKVYSKLKVNPLIIHNFSEDELQILKKYEFLVDQDFDHKQSLINKMTYAISKFNQLKDHLKIDFAVTNKCNFCCPYCFEKDELNSCCNNNDSENLIRTSEKLYTYIKNQIACGIKSLEIVFYGGEPTIKFDFIIDFINKIDELCKNSSVDFKYIFITNGYLFTQPNISLLNPDNCKFIQVTLDGEKELHNERRTNKAKINTFDVIIKNVNDLLKNNFHVVVRLNVDKTNYKSIANLLNSLETLIDKKYFGKLFSVDIARVFGSSTSFDLYEYEDIRENLFNIATKKNLLIPVIKCKNLTTFCIAETLSKDLVIDQNGNLYRCWNNVFNKDHAIGNISELNDKNGDPFETSNSTLEFVNSLALDKVNNGKCFDCEFCKYCQGLCPSVRKSIIENKERNIYSNDECKEIVKKRLKQLIGWQVSKND